MCEGAVQIYFLKNPRIFISELLHSMINWFCRLRLALRPVSVTENAPYLMLLSNREMWLNLIAMTVLQRGQLAQTQPVKPRTLPHNTAGKRTWAALCLLSVTFEAENSWAKGHADVYYVRGSWCLHTSYHQGSLFHRDGLLLKTTLGAWLINLERREEWHI